MSVKYQFSLIVNINISQQHLANVNFISYLIIVDIIQFWALTVLTVICVYSNLLITIGLTFLTQINSEFKNYEVSFNSNIFNR